METNRVTEVVVRYLLVSQLMSVKILKFHQLECIRVGLLIEVMSRHSGFS